MNIKETAKEIHEINKSKGFYDTEKNIGEMLMLVVSEISEALEADRQPIISPVTGEEFNVTGRVKEYIDNLLKTDVTTFMSTFEEGIKNSFSDEIADAIIRLLDLAEYKNIDIEWHIRAKMNYNKNRPRLHNKKY